MLHPLRSLLLFVAALAASWPVLAQPAEKWATAWTASVQGPYPIGNPSAQPDQRFAFPSPETGARDQTFRLVVRPDIWGRQARFRFSNALGTKPLTVDGAFVGLHYGSAAIVSVSEDARGRGQCWTRIYARRKGFPQVIHSAKRFAGPTGLEEYLGRGLGMALRLEALSDGLAFVSDHYFLQLGSRRLRLPRWLGPGQARITHRQVAGPSFLFELTIEHRWAGRLLHQQVIFEDVE